MKTKLSVILLSMILVTASCGNNKSTGSNNVPETTVAQTVDSKMVIIARLTVNAEKVKDFTEAAKDIIAKSNTEEGCTYYQLFQDPYDNTKFVFVEEYKNQAAVDFHFGTEYFKAFGPKIGDLIVGAPEIKVITVAKEVVQ
jgi:quinol monooxygenase YgiN